jgi:hypothetical protein
MKRLALVLLLLWPLTGDAQQLVRVRDADGKVVAELTVAAGASVEVLPPGPGPQPNPRPLPDIVPNPAPNPNPTPVNPPAPPPQPAPNVGPVKHVVVVRDDTPGVMTAAQQAALRDPALRAQLLAKGLSWHVFDIGSVEVQQKPPAGLGYAKWFAGPPNLKAPALLLLDAQGKLVRGVPLPADAAGLIAAVGN